MSGNVNRNTIEIKVWLLRNGLTMRDIATEAKINHALVVRTINGDLSNRRVLRQMMAMGCPVKLLALPSDMQVAA